jgi:hypothetical protein
MLEWFGRRQTIALPINSVVGCLIATILLMISSENNVRTRRHELLLRSSAIKTLSPARPRIRPIGGEGFAVDASLIQADANKHRSSAGAVRRLRLV